jgi:hypothetical protein
MYKSLSYASVGLGEERTPTNKANYLLGFTTHPQPTVSIYYTVMPRRVPEVLTGIARKGAARMPHVAGGTGSPFWQPPLKLRHAR